MADNVNYQPAGSTVIATDDVSGIHYQRVKLQSSAADSVEELSKAEDAAHVSGDHGFMALGVRKDTATALAGTDGDYQPSIYDASGRLWTNPSGVTTPVAGDVAHGATNAGNPMQVGCESIAHGANPTAVATGQRTKNYANRAGIPFTIGGHPNVVTIEASTTGAQTDVAMVTVATGLKIVVTQAQVIADNANTAFPQVRLGFGTANTPTTTGVVLTHPGIPAGGGVSRGDGSGILGVGADNEDLRMTNGAPTGGSLRFLVSYFTCES